MTDLPDDRRYTAEHEWARIDGGRVLVGVTDYAQDQLGDVVFVALPEPGTEVEAGKPLGEIESTKSVSDIYSPVAGKVVERNAELEQTPQLVNEDPYGRGWLVVLEGDNASLDELLSAEEYRALIQDGA